MMRMLGIIPARAGSKRVPGKNIADLGGEPLIAWSIRTGLATCDAGVVVSTDGDEIAAVAGSYGVTVVRRPPELATDEAPTEPVVIHAAENFGPGAYDAVLLLQATSPFRSLKDIHGAAQLMDSVRADSVISVIRYPERDALFTIGHANRLRPASNDTMPIYTPNGVIYIIRKDMLAEDWYGPGAYGYVMAAHGSIDINTYADFDAARAMLDADGKLKA